MMDQDENFDAVRKLLRCKRYEQPPPGYFLSFSDKVLARIEADDVAQYSSWWSWLVNRFDAKPVLVCVYGLAVSGLLLMGFRLSHVFEAELNAAPVPGGPWLAATPASPMLSWQGIGETTWIAGAAGLARARWNFRDNAEYHGQGLPAGSLQVQPAGLFQTAH
jgi:hypothetical protein